MPEPPKSQRVQSFLKTEEDEKKQLKDIFEQYSAAKIITDGFIVPNIVVNAAEYVIEGY